LSLSPDSVIPTTIAIVKKEKQLRKRRGLLGLF